MNLKRDKKKSVLAWREEQKWGRLRRKRKEITSVQICAIVAIMEKKKTDPDKIWAEGKMNGCCNGR